VGVVVHAAAEAEDSGTEGIEAEADDTELSKQIVRRSHESCCQA
jgi:hypothetical protein